MEKQNKKKTAQAMKNKYKFQLSHTETVITAK
jgi:hypothetical protein